MNKLITILSLALLALVAMPVDAATRTKRTITLKKVPKQPKDDCKDRYKIPAIPLICLFTKAAAYSLSTPRKSSPMRSGIAPTLLP